MQMLDCLACGECCRVSWDVIVFEDEFKKINNAAEKLNIKNWHQFDEQRKVYVISKTTNNYACVFQENNVCKLHSHFDASFKPLMCIIAPVSVIFAENQYFVGVSFHCNYILNNPQIDIKKISITYQKYFKQLFDYLTKLYPIHLKKTMFFNKQVDWQYLRKIESDLIELIDYNMQNCEYIDLLLLSKKYLELVKTLNLNKFDKTTIELLTSFKTGILNKFLKNKKVAENKNTTAINQTEISTQQTLMIEFNWRIRLFAFALIIPYYFSELKKKNNFINRLKTVIKINNLLLKLIFNFGKIELKNLKLKFGKKNTRIKKEILDYLKNYFIIKVQSQSFFFKEKFDFSFEHGYNILIYKQLSEIYLLAASAYNKNTDIDIVDLKQIVYITEIFFEHLTEYPFWIRVFLKFL